MDENNSYRLAPHETFDLHELLVMKTLNATKASVMSALVKDELKAILQQDTVACQEHIRELQALLENSVLAPTELRNDENTN